MKAVRLGKLPWRNSSDWRKVWEETDAGPAPTRARRVADSFLDAGWTHEQVCVVQMLLAGVAEGAWQQGLDAGWDSANAHYMRFLPEVLK